MFGIGNSNQIEELNKQLSAVQAEKLTLETRLDDLENTIHTLAQKEQNYKKQIKTHEVKLAEVMSSVNKKVNIALASMGVNTFAAETFAVGSVKSDNELLAQFNTLAGTEKTAFYQKNKAAISRALLNNNHLG